jgi:hypothetical protein
VADIAWDVAIPNPNTWEFGLRSTVLQARALYTGALRTASLPGARWLFRAQWNVNNNLGRAQGDALRALLVKLRGGANRLLMYDIAQPTFRGVGGGTPLVQGAAQTGITLAIDGCPISTTGWALPGDKFSVNGELKMIVSQANTDGAGQVTLTFEPPLRASPADNAPLTILQPTARFVLVGPDVSWIHETTITSGVSLQFEEAFL